MMILCAAHACIAFLVPPGLPVDGTILCEKAKMIAAQLNIENFTPSNGG
jgi:hypothetical protein